MKKHSELPKYILFGSLGGILILAIAGGIAYYYITHKEPKTQEKSLSSKDSNQVLPESGNIERRDQNAFQDFQIMRENNPQLNFLLPPSNEDGTPFMLTDASEHANLGFKALREKRFQDAVNEYRMATQLDARYQPTLERTEQLAKDIQRYGFDKVKNKRVFPGDRLTYKQLYAWK